MSLLVGQHEGHFTCKQTVAMPVVTGMIGTRTVVLIFHFEGTPA